MWTNSVVNLVSARHNAVEPAVGMGVTELCWTDRHPWEIIAVKDSRHITIRRLDSKRIDDNGFSESQEYEYYSNPDNRVINLYKDNKGLWRERIGTRGLGETKFSVGRAEEYYDFTF